MRTVNDLDLSLTESTQTVLDLSWPIIGVTQVNLSDPTASNPSRHLLPTALLLAGRFTLWLLRASGGGAGGRLMVHRDGLMSG